MLRNLFLTAAALVLLFLSACPTRAAEITIDWRQKLDSGSVWDLKFMPGQDEFIIGTTYDLQVRSCEDGGILNKYPVGALKIEFTPDSNRIILLPTGGTLGRIHIRDINSMNLIKEYILTPDEEGYSVYFSEMVVDPVRPYIYTILNRQKDVFGNLVVYRKILIFDRETLNPVGELTTPEDEELLLVNLAISKDGKYLAVMNEGKISKLMVWSLDTRQKIVDKYISDPSSKEFSDPADVKFSELNTDKILFTGQFYKNNNDGLVGLCIFSISENRIIDSTFAIGVNSGIAHIAFFESGQKILLGGFMIKVINLNDMQLEYKRIYNENDNIISATYPDYNEEKKFFLGFNPGGIINRFKYQPNTSVPTENPKEVIYPNPTTGIVNIPINCLNSRKYEIYNTLGRLVNSAEITGATNNLLTIDFSSYPNGVYIVKLYCGKQISQYQIIKEG